MFFRVGKDVLEFTFENNLSLYKHMLFTKYEDAHKAMRKLINENMIENIDMDLLHFILKHYDCNLFATNALGYAWSNRCWDKVILVLFLHVNI